MPTSVEIGQTQRVRFKRLPPKPLSSSPPPKKHVETLVGQHWVENGVLWVMLGNGAVNIPAGFADRQSWVQFANSFATCPQTLYRGGPFGPNDFPYTCTDNYSGYLIAAKTNVVAQLKTFLITNNFGTNRQREIGKECFPSRLMQNISVPSTNGNVKFSAQYVSMACWRSWQDGIDGMVFQNNN